MMPSVRTAGDGTVAEGDSRPGPDPGNCPIPFETVPTPFEDPKVEVPVLPPMEALELHYGRGKLVRLGLLALVMAAAALWVALGGIDVAADRRGRGAWLMQLVGPSGLQAIGWILAAVSIVLAVLYLRRAFGDPVAARADAAGVTLHSLFGTHLYAAGDIERLELEHPMGQAILQVIPAPGRGRKRGLAANGLVEDGEEVQAWIEAAHARLREAELG
jgi:hypothetical protein